jgi:hypothetical protein
LLTSTKVDLYWQLFLQQQHKMHLLWLLGQSFNY